MKTDLSQMKPETRRIVIHTGAKLSMDFDTALEYLINEGIKAVCADSADLCPLVHKGVDKPGKTLGA